MTQIAMISEEIATPYRRLKGDVRIFDISGSRPVELTGSPGSRTVQEVDAIRYVFDGPWYLSQYPDAAKAVSKREFSTPFEHYSAVGIHLGYRPFWVPDISQKPVEIPEDKILTITTFNTTAPKQKASLVVAEQVAPAEKPTHARLLGVIVAVLAIIWISIMIK